MPFPKYAKKEEIPAGAEDVYEEQGGEWVPKLEDVSGLKTTLEKVRGEKTAAEKALAAARTEAEKAARERDALAAQVGDPEKKVADLLKKFDADVAEKVAAAEARATEMEAQVRDLTLGAEARKAFVDVGGRAERADAVMTLYGSRLEMADGRPVVKDKDGKVSTKTLADFFKDEVKAETPEFFSGTKAGGGGAGGFNGGTAGTPGLTFEQLMGNPSLGLAVANESGTAT